MRLAAIVTDGVSPASYPSRDNMPKCSFTDKIRYLDPRQEVFFEPQTTVDHENRVVEIKNFSKTAASALT